jgi:hypothetical protein
MCLTDKAITLHRMIRGKDSRIRWKDTGRERGRDRGRMEEGNRDGQSKGKVEEWKKGIRWTERKRKVESLSKGLTIEKAEGI